MGPLLIYNPGLTFRTTPPAKEQAFKAMRASLESGANCWNGGEIYGPPERNSLHLLHEYFTQYPEDAEKVVLSIKGGYTTGGIRGGQVDGSPENIKRSIDECLRLLDGKKFLDLFECARVDPKVPVETSIAAINEYVKAGKIGGISLSEVSEKTIRRASKVAKIAAVEVEFSLWATDILSNGVAQACAELNIPVIAYSPIGRGFLVRSPLLDMMGLFLSLTFPQTGEIKSPDDLPEGDFRRMLPRFQGEAFYTNLKLVTEIEQIAKRKGTTAAQVGIAWIKGCSGKDGLPVMIPIPGATSESRVKENSADITLTSSEMAEIQDILKTFTVVGGRYGAATAHLSEG